MNWLNPFQQFVCTSVLATVRPVDGAWPYWFASEVDAANGERFAYTRMVRGYVSIKPDRTAWTHWDVREDGSVQIIGEYGSSEPLVLPPGEPACERFYRIDRPYTWMWVGAAALLGAGAVYLVGGRR